MASMDRLDRVVSDLERDQNLQRIKKLLYCSCYGVWEDAPARLEQVALRDIVQGVWERSPTLDALQFQLNRIVKTLNKPVEYAHVANTILRAMTPLYRTAYDITRPLNRPASSAAPATQWFGAETGNSAAPQAAQPLTKQQLEAQVSQSLSEHEETVRLKKLLICVCKNHWENDAQRLMAQDWTELLRETQVLIPTLDNLDYVLQAIVKSLSKPLDYLPIASTLLESLRPLYDYRPKSANTQFYGIDDSPAYSQPAAPEPTEFYTAPVSLPPSVNPPASAPAPAPVQQNWMADSPATAPLQGVGVEVPTGLVTPQSRDATGDAPPDATGDAASNATDDAVSNAASNATGDATMANPELLNALQQSFMEEAEQRLSSEAGTSSPGILASSAGPATISAEPASTALATQSAPRDDFGLRLDIMRYANPLMVKIVAFSAIHRLFRFSEQDWTELHHHSLNGLLTTLRHNYPNFTDLETKLCLTAEQIELQDNAMKTVAAMLKVLKPCYGDAVVERQFSLSPPPANSLEDDLDRLAATLEDDNADENSCQVF